SFRSTTPPPERAASPSGRGAGSSFPPESAALSKKILPAGAGTIRSRRLPRRQQSQIAAARPATMRKAPPAAPSPAARPRAVRRPTPVDKRVFLDLAVSQARGQGGRDD